MAVIKTILQHGWKNDIRGADKGVYFQDGVRKIDMILGKVSINKGDVLLEFSSVKWVLNEDYSFYSNLMGTFCIAKFCA